MGLRLDEEIIMKLFSKLLYRILPLEWTQPPLSSDGTMGGNSFAVSATTNGGVPNVGRGTAWGACYPQNGAYHTYTKGGAPSIWFTLYTPIPTITTGCSFTAVWGNYSDSYMYITFEGSNDNSNWVTLYPKTYLHEGDKNITFNNTSSYQYYRLTINTTGGGYHDGMHLSNIKLNAVYEDFI